MVSQLPRAAERKFFLLWLLTSGYSTLSTVMERGVPRSQTTGSTACVTCSPVRD